MTEMQAAIGRIALTKLSRWLEIRRRNAEIYNRSLSGLSALHIPVPAGDIKHAWYRFYLYVIPERLKPGWSRDRIMNEIGKSGRPGLSGTCCEIYREKAFSSADLNPEDRLPNARWLTENSLMLPVHPALSSEDIEDIAGTVAAVVEEATV